MPQPVSPTFALEITAAVSDIDELDHVSNLVYVRWVQDVAQAHSEAVGYDVPAYRDLGAAFVVRRHEIDYLQPAFAGDRIVLRTWIESWKAASSVRRTEIVCLRQQGAINLAQARTLWALMNLETGRPQRIPETLTAAFAQPLE